jgi:hypothetical protein
MISKAVLAASELDSWREQRDKALAQVEHNAGAEFMDRAKAFVLRYLICHLAGASGEDITDAAKAFGIVPHNDKAFGPVYASLSRSGQIAKCGYAKRKKGHGTHGAILWCRCYTL